MIRDINKINKILEKNNKISGNLFKGSNVDFEYINNSTIKVKKHSYPYDFLGYIEVIPLLRGDNWGFTFYKVDIKGYEKRVSLDNYHIQAISTICKKLNMDKTEKSTSNTLNTEKKK